MPISFAHNAIFIHIPKTGGQSVSKLMGIPKGSTNDFYIDGLTHLTLPMIEKRTDISNKYLFTFVRNPYDKIASEYCWRMLNRSSIIFNEPTRDKLTFTDYMELLLERWDMINLTPRISHARWREIAHVVPQSVYLDERIEVYRYEDFLNECNRLKAKFGIDRWVPYINKGHGLPEHTERTREITRILYREDFERLGYDYLTKT